ncbi:Flp pilus assembly complex ATPase component TadA [PVC group bacterium]|nr:Flp pilus assembly complex ATPase component TadA [PVC group bacterium]
MEQSDYQKLGEILVDQGLLTQAQLEDALAEQERTGVFLGEILVSKGVSDDVTIARALSTQLGFAYVDVSQMTVDPEALNFLNQDVCQRLNAIPLYIMRDNLTVAMANPLDVIAVDELETVSGQRIKPVFGSVSMIRKAIQSNYQTEKNSTQNLINSPPPTSLTENFDSLEEAANLAPVIKTVDQMIEKAVRMKASDIHLEPRKNILNCRYRIDGILREASKISLTEQAAIISRIKIMSNLDIAEKRLPQDGRVKVKVSGKDIDLRVSTFPTLYGESLVMRILDHSSGVLTPEQLGFDGVILDDFNKLIKRPYGMILVTGPTGSGKTSTLYAALEKINSEEKNIMTLEDPVEYEMDRVRQSQVNVKAGLTFASGLRSMVRQDPDIIMIGEIRDKETADIAMHAALTGHLVFSTLHTNDAPSAAARLIDMGVEPFLVSSAMIGILAQRLVRVLCPDCKKVFQGSVSLLKDVGFTKKADSDQKIFEENGCANCRQSGFMGRTGIFELLMINDPMRSAIAQKQSAVNLKKIAAENGMITLRESGLQKVTKGITSISEVLRVTDIV